MSKTVSGKHVKVIDRVSLAVGSAAVVLQAGERYYLVGVSDKNIQLICELEGFEPASPAEEGAQASFGRLLTGFLNREKPGTSKDDGTRQ